VGVGIAAGLLYVTAAAAQDTPRGNAANGKKLFETIGCFECHGYAGQGGGAGPKLVERSRFPPSSCSFARRAR
jgi:mono/diheme cytochrome c family protein